MIRPRLDLDQGLATPAVLESLKILARTLGADPSAIPSAVNKAAAAQADYEAALASIGQEALAYAATPGIPTVVVCGSQHVIHDKAANPRIPDLLRQNGAMAVPMDCFPIPEDVAPLRKIYWGDANRYLRAALAAREMKTVFPLMLASFGCGPASFTEQVFRSARGLPPHDPGKRRARRGGRLYSRIQAFLQSVHQYRAEEGRTPCRITPATCLTWNRASTGASISTGRSATSSSAVSITWATCWRRSPAPMGMTRYRPRR